MAFWYTVVPLTGAAALFVPFVLLAGAQRWLDPAFAFLARAASPGPFALVGIVFAAVCSAILFRYLLLSAFNPRRFE